MYLVVSHWEPLPGHESQFEQIGRNIRAAMRSQPGVEVFEAFASNGKTTVVHGYRDESTYESLISNPNGPFAKALESSKIEQHARWLDSERGETKSHD